MAVSLTATRPLLTRATTLSSAIAPRLKIRTFSGTAQPSLHASAPSTPREHPLPRPTCAAPPLSRWHAGASQRRGDSSGLAASQYCSPLAAPPPTKTKQQQKTTTTTAERLAAVASGEQQQQQRDWRPQRGPCQWPTPTAPAERPFSRPGRKSQTISCSTATKGTVFRRVTAGAQGKAAFLTGVSTSAERPPALARVRRSDSRRTRPVRLLHATLEL